MAIDPPEPHPEREKLETLITHCKKRASRAAEKLEAAMRENHEASRALSDAELRLCDWIDSHPDPQPSLL